METKIMTIFTRTPLHVGAGASVGAIDQPVIRERHTKFPIIPGSSIKGVLADLWMEAGTRNDKGKILFGEDSLDKPAESGALAFGEAKILAFPVRSAKGCFAFITSPLCLQRFARDSEISLPIPSLHGMNLKCLAGCDVIFDQNEKKSVVLEEYKFEVVGEFPKEWADKLSGLIEADEVLKGSLGRFVLLSDEDLSFYVENSCQVSQHVSIDSETGTAAKGKLFNQEEVPSETLFYTPITMIKSSANKADMIKEAVAAFNAMFEKEKLVQFGGKGTSGIGYCSVQLS